MANHKSKDKMPADLFKRAPEAFQRPSVNVLGY